ncbi:hypothetical protein Rhow_008073 [Rhodococcus wratislaviensis]|uniref:Ferritin-like domain-containing protein n=1 Tax=Rhodococcus wratislaviensis TaxID=44752 RepID=A0A402CJQ4_RHOWR|nr:hypothetical protein Rhow_008073 [Rhodococcus wratislaviensis]
MSWSTRGLDRAIETLTASRDADAALQTAEDITRREGATAVAEAIHSARTTAGVLDPGELPIGDYDDLTVPQAVAAVKELTDPADIRAVVAYEEAHKSRHGVVSAAQAHLAAIAQEVAGIT